ncbi:hypothetical protein B0181_05805 [Moraxella caviae]|uniref:Inner membrane protein yeeR n=1 Tax=Moraxella caviae TaxID=34060 RepID=A0A1T0A2H0_9GAMM|nr:hypothetical protein [Moraxella caviae]OOR89924.1 hypothetical protein B0181_05805 [Moraxella caviae]STZ14307.1 Inner membrane protein yeeR [Moraxella caviae]VEW12234.1 Inner membrane protein yeeR [Moraxella caviae]
MQAEEKVLIRYRFNDVLREIEVSKSKYDSEDVDQIIGRIAAHLTFKEGINATLKDLFDGIEIIEVLDSTERSQTAQAAQIIGSIAGSLLSTGNLTDDTAPNLSSRQAALKAEHIPGTTAGSLMSAENFSDNVVLNASRGHGFAAEKANHLYDTATGKNAQIVGGDNAKNGADRLVNGVQIQTKFCSSGSKCISECFENGKFRYWADNGKPMQIEVPKDFAESAKLAFIERIKKGQVIDVSNMTPSEIQQTAETMAEETIKASPFTYAQARNIARFGTIESLTYDAANGVKLAGTAMCITSAICFARTMWSGEDFDVALKTACNEGIKVGGITWISSIATAQLGRTGAVQALRPATDFIIAKMGAQNAARIANSVRIGSKPVYGAAAKTSASKLLRGNAVTGIVTVTVLSSVDLFRMFQGRVSGAQVFKNVINTGVGVAAGTAGWASGVATGAALGSFIPGIGTAAGGILGGIIGSLGGGAAASKVSSVVMDSIIEDDSKKMQAILGEVFTQLAEDYLLSESEATQILDELAGILTIDVLRDMHAAPSQYDFANDLIEPLVEEIARNRPHILLPNLDQISDGVEQVLEDMLKEEEPKEQPPEDENLMWLKEVWRSRRSSYRVTLAQVRKSA